MELASTSELEDPPVRGRSNAHLRNQPPLVRIGGAVLVAAAAFALSTWVHLPQQGYTFLLLYPVVIASAYFAGRDAGLAATGACVLMVAARLLLTWEETDMLLVQVASLILFIVIGAGSAILLSRLNRALRQLQQSNVQLVEATEDARRANEETDLLLRELRHRIRNDLSNIVAIIRLQARSLSETAAEHLVSAADRLQVLAQVHERLSRQGHRPVVEMKPFLEDLCANLRSTLLPLKPVAIQCDVDELSLPSTRAVSVGLIVNELVTNAIKYAYPDDREGSILVYLECSDHVAEVGVEDDGIGISDQSGDSSGSGLGHRLVRSLAAQLNGRFECDSHHPGAACVVTFPLDPGGRAKDGGQPNDLVAAKPVAASVGEQGENGR
jgi:two-component system, sensor histidine kinase PdtaS